MRVTKTIILWLVFSAIVLVATRAGEAQVRGESVLPVEANHFQTLERLLQRLDEQDGQIAQLRYELNTAFRNQSAPPLPTPNVGVIQNDDAGRATLAGHTAARQDTTAAELSTESFTEIGTSQQNGVNLNTHQSLFHQGIVIQSNHVAMKIGGYVKVDVIQDFQPIANEFAFDTQTILVNAPPRENSNIHARQSRLNFDTRWETDYGPVRAFIEGDFFGDGNSVRLRHAYGEVKNLIVGQTWSTFANVRALPPTLDNEGSASIISRRQGQVRWTQQILIEDLSFSVALEDPRLLVTDTITMLQLQPLTESPDLVGRLRYENADTSLQISGVTRRLGLLGPSENRAEANAWGMNLSGTHKFSEYDEGYAQVIFGNGIGSYNSVPDVVSDGVSRGELLPLFGWMVGWNHRWSDRLQSSIVYSENRLDSPSFQPGMELRSHSYFATNLIWAPAENYFTGIEYLYGIRQNVDLQDSEAHRLQMSFGFLLP